MTNAHLHAGQTGLSHDQTAQTSDPSLPPQPEANGSTAVLWGNEQPAADGACARAPRAAGPEAAPAAEMAALPLGSCPFGSAMPATATAALTVAASPAASADAPVDNADAKELAGGRDEEPSFPGFPKIITLPTQSPLEQPIRLSSPPAMYDQPTPPFHANPLPPTADPMTALCGPGDSEWVLQAASGLNPPIQSGLSGLLKSAGLQVPAGMELCIHPHTARPEALSPWPPCIPHRSQDVLRDVIALEAMSLKRRRASTMQGGLGQALTTVAVLHENGGPHPLVLQGPHSPPSPICSGCVRSGWA